MDLDKSINRGLRADSLLKDQLITEAREHIEAELWRMFKEATPSDNESLAFIKGMQYFHAKYFAFFERAVNDGKMAKLNLENKKKTLKERFLG